MKPKTIAFLLLLALPAAASARLGDTEKELVKRFGPATERRKETTFAYGKDVEFGDRLVFKQGDWIVESVVVDGRCAWESYTKAGDWNEKQLLLVLTTNAQGARWTELTDFDKREQERDWRREDGGTAHWQAKGPMVVVHPAYDRAKARAEAKAKADEARLPKI